MKTIFKTFSLGVLFMALFAVGGISAFGQNDACADVDGMNANYQTVLDNYRAADSATFQKAVDAAKAFLEKYGSCDVAKQNADWIKGNITKWEKALADKKVQEVKGPILKRFDTAIQTKNYDDAYAAGNDYLTKFPDDQYRIHVIVPLAWIGYKEALNKNYKYDANALKYSKNAIELLRAGTLPPKAGDTYGTFEFTCTGKDECISLLTFGSGYMTFFGENNKQAALPYYYEVTKLSGSFQKYPAVYGTIGDFYYESVKKIGDELKAKIADQKDTDADDVKAKKEADIKATIAMLNGYAERAMDAYSRAYTLAKADPKAGAYAGNVYKAIQTLYTIRFQKQDGIDTWISSTVAKPFPDPTSPVAPIEPDTTTGTTGPGTTTAAPVTAPAKPATTGPAKPAATNKVGTGAGAAPASTQTAVKKKGPR
jgi:tetratricopeptide (TPR) repeat protein